MLSNSVLDSVHENVRLIYEDELCCCMYFIY